MKVEIEAKLKIDSLADMAEKLKRLGGVFDCELIERDSFFADKNRLIVGPGCGLRLRKQTRADSAKIILTYKGPRQKTTFKTRQEIETEVADMQAMEEMLAAIGCEKKLIFEKKRHLWRLENCTICLDELPMLGFFIEVEGPDESAVAEVLKKLNLSEKDHISEGYAVLIRKKLSELGIKTTEVLFEKTGGHNES